MTGTRILSCLVVLQVLAPAVTLALVGLPALLGLPPRERGVTRAVGAGFAIALAAAAGALAMLATRGFAPHHVHLGTWFHVGHHEDKLGQRASNTVALSLENVRVPA